MNSNLTTIESMAFYESSISSIMLPSSLTSIEDNGFLQCKKLANVDFYDPQSTRIKSFGANAFAKTHLKKITIPSHLKKICYAALGFNGLRYVVFPEDSELEMIGVDAFASTQIRSICIPHKIVHINEGSFRNCVNLLAVELTTKAKVIYVHPKSFKCSQNVSIFIQAGTKLIQHKLKKAFLKNYNFVILISFIHLDHRYYALFLSLLN